MWMLVDHPQSTIDMWCDDICRSHFGSSHFGSSRFGLRGGASMPAVLLALRDTQVQAQQNGDLVVVTVPSLQRLGVTLRPAAAPPSPPPGDRYARSDSFSSGPRRRRSPSFRRSRRSRSPSRPPPCQRSGSGSRRRDHFWSARQVFPSMPRISIAGQSTWASVWLVSW